MMYVYKIKPCKRTVCNFPCTPCPFLHDGKVGRRDLLWHKYSCIPCVDFISAGFCPRGVACGCAHGIIEQRFHPMLFRTRYCWYMTSCKRKDCSYAHKEEEKRVPTIAPYVMTCPRSSQANSSVLRDIFANSSSALNPTNLWSNPDSCPSFETTRNQTQERSNLQEPMLSLRDQFGPSYSLMKHETTDQSPPNNSVQMNNLLNQPDFSWVHFLVEDDGDSLNSGLIGETNLEEQDDVEKKNLWDQLN